MNLNNIISFDRFYKSELLSDTNFMLQDCDDSATRITTHHFILASRSNISEQMFFGDLEQGQAVNITEGFVEFLRLFYMAKVNLSTVHIGEVLELIDKYYGMD